MSPAAAWLVGFKVYSSNVLISSRTNRYSLNHVALYNKIYHLDS